MKGTRLPAGAIAGAYLAAGFCLFTSGNQMHEVFAAHDVAGNGAKPLMLCLAILGGGSIMWRLAGHLRARQAAGFSFALVLAAAVYTEAMSIGTSTMSLTTGVNARLIEDKQQSASYQAAKSASNAAAITANRLAENLANMPSNYYTRGSQTADQIGSILEQQKELLQLQAQAGTENSATAQTLSDIGNRFGWTADEVKNRWSLGIALALSLIPLATQLALGTLSDATMKSGQAGDIMRDDPELPHAKKSHGLHAVK